MFPKNSMTIDDIKLLEKLIKDQYNEIPEVKKYLTDAITTSKYPKINLEVLTNYEKKFTSGKNTRNEK